MTRISIDDFYEAAEKMNRAKAIEKQAADLKTSARKTILAYYEENPGVFVVAPDSETGRTLTVSAKERTVRITTPMSAEVPSRFDQARSEEFFEKLEDLGLADFIEEAWVVSRTLDEQKFTTRLKEMANTEDDRGMIAKDIRAAVVEISQAMLPFVLPAKPETALAPRVEVK